METIKPIRWPVKVIGEIGCNHKGDMTIAKEMVDVAASFCRVDGVKFQKRCNKELLSEEEYNSPHPNPYNSYGSTYGEHREFLEFTADQHQELKDYCESKGLEYSTSVWDLTSAQEMAALRPKWLKIPSACNTDHVMMDWLLNNYEGQIHVSFGMTKHDEEEAIVEMFESRDRTADLVIYSCTSGYPVPFEDVCLMEIARLQEQYLHTRRCSMVGFSGHHLGICVDAIAAAMGARVIERHYTLDRTWKGTDHAASLEPDGLRRVARDVKVVRQILSYKEDEILPIEQVQRDKLKRFREK